MPASHSSQPPHKTEQKPVRVGAVNYLNSKPLIESLEKASGLQLSLDLPSRLADALASRQIDVGLIPSVELFRNTGYTIVSDACIACYGPVSSVKLFFRKSPREVQTLALDEGSRTSAVLSQILLKERFGISPALEQLPIGDGMKSCQADAILLIGDRAMDVENEGFSDVWDLGEGWMKLTGLPFVFATWAARPGFHSPGLDALLSKVRDDGVNNLSSIAKRESNIVGIPAKRCFEYLNKNLHFTLGEAERKGLATFYQHAHKYQLVPSGWEPIAHDIATT